MARTKSVQDRLDEIAIKKANLELKRTEREIAQWEAQDAGNSRKNAERQSQLRSDIGTRLKLSRLCKHRQGGTPSNPYNGQGKTSLNVATMPDGFTLLVMCSVCRLRAFSPHPGNQSKKPKHVRGEGGELVLETQDQIDARIEKYWADKEYFDDLIEQSKDTLTPEAAQPMECGVTITLTNEDGLQVLPKRPCDSYALTAAQ